MLWLPVDGVCGSPLIDTGVRLAGSVTTSAGDTTVGQAVTGAFRVIVPTASSDLEGRFFVGSNYSEFSPYIQDASLHNSAFLFARHGSSNNTSGLVNVMQLTDVGFPALQSYAYTDGVASFTPSYGLSAYWGVAGPSALNTVSVVPVFHGQLDTFSGGAITTGNVFDVGDANFSQTFGAITNQRGYNCADLTKATNNECFHSDVSAGSGKFAINAVGTAVSHLGGLIDVPQIQTVGVLTSALPACASGTWGMRGAVTDATAPAIGVALTGGGTIFATVHCSKTTSTYFVDGL